MDSESVSLEIIRISGRHGKTPQGFIISFKMIQSSM